MNRYSRQVVLSELGTLGQEKLAQAKVLIIGMGGLGCFVAPPLVAAGVGEVVLVDHDLVQLHNLQRQVLFTEGDLGQNKAIAATRHLEKLNSTIKICAHEGAFSTANAHELADGVSLIIDCTDNFTAKYLINDVSEQLGIPCIIASVHRFEGQLGVFNYQGSASYRDAFESAPPPHLAPNCELEGVLGATVATMGSLQALEALKILANINEVLTNTLLLFDGLTTTFRKIKIKKQLRAESPQTPFSYIQQNELTTMSHLRLIDVREPHEHLARNLGGENLPMGSLSQIDVALDSSVVLYCQSGARATAAAEFLANKFTSSKFYVLQQWAS